MKALIWISCFIIATILNTILGYATGIKLGYLLFYVAVYFVAKKLCSKWDEHKENKTMKKTSSIPKQQPIPAKSDQVRFCRMCGEKLIDNSKFCRKCGIEVVKE